MVAAIGFGAKLTGDFFGDLEVGIAYRNELRLLWQRSRWHPRL